MEARNPHPSHPHTPPFKQFGRTLKAMRQRFQESLGEVSGAVEIAVEQLDRFERGAELPNEDILMLLISHFNLGDDEAVALWELAGYEPDDRLYTVEEDDIPDDSTGRAERSDRSDHANRPASGTPIMMIALDNRVLYTNGAEVVTDKAGLVINFIQSDNAAKNPQRYAVSRVGMSYSQAEQLLDTLNRALLHKRYLSGPKGLPPSGSSADDKRGKSDK
jgi:hypothetical protein